MKKNYFKKKGIPGMIFMAFLLTFTSSLNAQVANYHFAQSAGTYQPLTASTTIALATGAASSGADGINNVNIPVAIPFPFLFDNVSYDTCRVTDNGFITFGSSMYSANFPISNPGTAAGTVSAMGIDLWGIFVTGGSLANGSSTISNVVAFNGLAVGKAILATGLPAGTTVLSFNTGAGTIQVSNAATATSNNAAIRWGAGEIRKSVTGISPNRKLTIEYLNFSDNNGVFSLPNSTAFNFQIQLEETSNKINVVYGSFVTAVTGAKTCQIGLRGTSNVDFNNRNGGITTSWASTTSGTTSAATVARNNVNYPSNGLTYSWEPATCYFPTGITFSAITATSFILGWNLPALGNTPSGYQWEIRTSGLPGSGATGLVSGNSISGNSVSVSGLTASTSYNIYIRTDCGSSNFSNWSPAIVFKTPCNTVQSTPYLEDFSTFFSYLNPPACWIKAAGYLKAATKFSVFPSTALSWVPSYWQNDYNDQDAVIGMMADNKNEWLISPSINLGTSGNKQVELDLMITNAMDQDTVLGADDTFALVISTDNGVTWSNTNILKTWNALNTPLPASHITIPISAYTGTVKFGFYTAEGVFDKEEKISLNNFEVKNIPCFVLNLGADIDTCSNGNVTSTLNAGPHPGGSYLWDNLSTGQTRTVNTSGTYFVAVTVNGCTERDTVHVTYHPSPVSQLGNDTVLCGQDTLWLAPGNPGDLVYWYYNLYNGAVRPVTVSGTYVAEIVNVGGCATIDSIAVTLVPVLPVINLGNDTTFCSGHHIILDAGNPGLANLWNDNSTGQQLTVSAGGTYFVKVTDNDGCTAADTIKVILLPSPSVFLGNDTNICEGTQVVLDAGNAGAAFLWDDGSVNQIRNADTSGRYIVDVTGANGCSRSDTIYITVHQVPVFDSIAVHVINGVHRFLVYGAAHVTAYSWDFGDGSANGTGPQPSHHYTSGGVFHVSLTVMGSGDCGNYSDTITVPVTALGIQDSGQDNPAIKLYPNPGKGKLQIDYPAYFENKVFVIYNINGSKVMSAAFQAKGKQLIDLSGAPSGTYCIQIIDEKQKWPVYKFIIAK